MGHPKLGHLLALAVLACAANAVEADDSPKKAAQPSLREVYALIHVPRLANEADEAKLRSSQLSWLKGRIRATVCQAKVKELHLVKQQKNPVEWLKASLKAEYLDNTGVLKLSVAGGSGQEQAAIVNALVRAHLSQIQDLLEKHKDGVEYRKSRIRDLEVSIQRTKDMLNDPVPAQINRQQFLNEIQSQVAKLVEQLEAAKLSAKQYEARLRTWGQIRVIEWAEAPSSK